MNYILAGDRKPESNVDVHIVTDNGTKSIARYWDVTGHWLTRDENLNLLNNDIVKKWKYADAT